MKERINLYQFTANELGQRTKIVRVFLPKDYDQGERRYPVLYMHDGQNLIDPSPYSGYAWDVMHAMDATEGEGVIIVGIDADPKMRILEYSGRLSERVQKILRRKMPHLMMKPEGEAYARFIVQKVKPFIDETYRTFPDRAHTGVAGSSCGGNISLLMLFWFPDIFGIVGAFSPAIWIIKDNLFALAQNAIIEESQRVYHDIGSKESRYFNGINIMRSRHFQKLLSQKGMDSTFVCDRGATHTELFWQARFQDFLKSYFFAPKVDK